MRRLILAVLTFGVLAVTTVGSQAIAADGPDGPPRRGDGDAGGRERRDDGPGGRERRDDGPGGRERQGGGGGFRLLPSFLVEQLNLTEDQVKRINDLEKEAKAKLDKILTPAQQKILSEARPRRTGPGGPGGRDGGRPGEGRRGPSEGGGRGDGQRGGDRGDDQRSRPQRPAPE